MNKQLSKHCFQKGESTVFLLTSLVEVISQAGPWLLGKAVAAMPAPKAALHMIINVILARCECLQCRLPAIWSVSVLAPSPAVLCLQCGSFRRTVLVALLLPSHTMLWPLASLLTHPAPVLPAGTRLQKWSRS